MQIWDVEGVSLLVYGDCVFFCRFVGTECFSADFLGTDCFSVVLWGLLLFLCMSLGLECVFLHV